MSRESKIAFGISRKYFEEEEHTKITDEFVESLGIANQIKDSFIIKEKIEDAIQNAIKDSSGTLSEDKIYKNLEMYVEILTQNGISRDDIYRSALIQNGLCGIDCTSLDFGNLSPESFRMLTFDTKTIFSPKQESTFHPSLILENGKEFGLGVDETGFSGKGIHIGIIDREFKEDVGVDNLILEDGDVDKNKPIDYHGLSTTSILASRECGIAKDSIVHFYRGGGKSFDVLDKILENNNNPENDKISIVSGSWRIEDVTKFEEYRSKLDEQGCDLICANVFDKYFHPVVVDENGKIVDDLLPTKDEIESICPKNDKTREKLFAMKTQREENIKVPINKTYHQEDGGYRYQASYSTSWCIPEIAGLFALCKEKNPDVRLVDFISVAKIVSENGLIDFEGITKNIDNVIEIRQGIQMEDSSINFDDLISRVVEKVKEQEKEKGIMERLANEALDSGVTYGDVEDADRTETIQLQKGKINHGDHQKGDRDD